MRLFITDIPAADLRDIINRTYTEAAFGTKAITPVRTLCDGIKIEALSNGPTLAFKDMAMQFLGNAFEYVLQKRAKRRTFWRHQRRHRLRRPNMPCAAKKA